MQEDEVLTRRKNRLLDSDPLVQTAESTIFGLQSSLESVVSSQVLGVIGLGKTVILEDVSDNLSENFPSSLLLVVIVIVVAEGIERWGLDHG